MLRATTHNPSHESYDLRTKTYEVIKYLSSRRARSPKTPKYKAYVLTSCLLSSVIGLDFSFVTSMPLTSHRNNQPPPCPHRLTPPPHAFSRPLKKTSLVPDLPIPSRHLTLAKQVPRWSEICPPYPMISIAIPPSALALLRHPWRSRLNPAPSALESGHRGVGASKCHG